MVEQQADHLPRAQLGSVGRRSARAHRFRPHRRSCTAGRRHHMRHAAAEADLFGSRPSSDTAGSGLDLPQFLVDRLLRAARGGPTISGMAGPEGGLGVKKTDRLARQPRLTAKPKEPKAEQRATEERERGRLRHPLDIRSGGACEERGGEQERRSLGHHGRSRRKRQ